jgi:hypothetical protein
MECPVKFLALYETRFRVANYFSSARSADASYVGNAIIIPASRHVGSGLTSPNGPSDAARFSAWIVATGILRVSW